MPTYPVSLNRSDKAQPTPPSFSVRAGWPVLAVDVAAVAVAAAAAELVSVQGRELMLGLELGIEIGWWRGLP